jgi:putative membrane protein
MNRLLKQFNWRFLLVRLLVNALAVAITAAVTPKIYFVDKSIWSWLLITVMLGILNTLLKPVLQFLTLQFIFVTYGLVIVLVNSLLLWSLSFLFPGRFAVDNLLWALLGGLVLGLVSSFLESLLGLTVPIVPEEEAALRRRLEEQARHIDWRGTAGREAIPEEQVPAIDPPAPEAHAAGAAVAETVVLEPAVPEPSAPVADEGPLTPAAVEPRPTNAAIPVQPELAPEPGEEEKEGERT